MLIHRAVDHDGDDVLLLCLWQAAIFAFVYLDGRQTARFSCGTVGPTPLD